MKIVKMTIFLSVVGAIIALALYFTNAITEPIITKNNQVKTEELLKEMVGPMDGYETVAVNQPPLINVYKIKQNGKVTAQVLRVDTFGFQSELDMLVMIKDGKYQGFQVVQQAETAGYGTQIVTNQSYRDQFKNRSINEPIETIAGSTVTTHKVKQAIEESIVIWKKLK